jgi:hypothetical protein
MEDDDQNLSAGKTLLWAILLAMVALSYAMFAYSAHVEVGYQLERAEWARQDATEYRP